MRKDKAMSNYDDLSLLSDIEAKLDKIEIIVAEKLLHPAGDRKRITRENIRKILLEA